ncbi:anti-sigma factor [Roseiconus nitratireducens]|uniref:Anti-sigma factor n=1 Tax=Roseiconus nitratireducens TaxID=2605748 RepID=A0A5M6CVR8_9BACT|nr:anti-sigma factor [Roseiconus nitratireducens]KAA5539321.1 anti-sigma factor [Roseiconus nitratireducens]
MSWTDIDEPQRSELIAGQVLGDLTEEESRLVDELLRDDRGAELLQHLQRTAASLQLTLHHLDPLEMPPELVERLRGEGRRMVIAAGASRPDALSAASTAKTDGLPESAKARPAPGGVSLREITAWFCAAAALLLAIGLWAANSEPVAPTARQLRAEMLAGETSLIRADWTAGPTPFDSPVQGDVVWDPTTQTGFMHFQGMPVNDPSEQQYQLWIIDPKRDDEPIDGGVFDISEAGDTVVPIDAKLDVIDPAAFAVTIEKPGGVVVSTQERLPLLAPVASKKSK